MPRMLDGEPAAETMRLQKYLARAGVASRRACEALITSGRVEVNGRVACELGTKVDPRTDNVTLDGAPVRLADSHAAIMLHKPSGVVTTMKAQSNAPIVADLVPCDRYPGLFPVGRLDADTTGLLLFTTDGELGNALLHPSRHVEKTYVADVDGAVKPHEVEQLRRGVELEDGVTLPANVDVLDGRRARRLRLVIREGRYHQVKRMLEAVGHRVVSLNREGFGPLVLGDLEPGRWRELSASELHALQRSCGLVP